MANLSTMSLPIRLFTFSGRTLSAFISDLEANVGGPIISRLYDDAAESGITVRGQTADVRFVLVETHRDRENDVTHWEFMPETPADCSGIERVQIFND